MKCLVFKNAFLVCFAVLLVVSYPGQPRAQETEETYAISLTKTPGIEKNIYKVDNKNVLTEEYTIKKGEWVWQVLREKGLLKKRNLSELLFMFTTTLSWMKFRLLSLVNADRNSAHV